MDRREQLFWRKVKRKNKKGCRNWSGIPDRKGYGHVNYLGYRTAAHRMAYILTHGPILKEMVVMHMCDNRLCCNPEHLKIGTQAENLSDMWAKGRGKTHIAYGEAHGRCKVTNEQVQEIKRLYGSTRLSHRKIGEMFGLGASQVARIVRGEGRLHG